jgi:hypothetical protein
MPDFNGSPAGYRPEALTRLRATRGELTRLCTRLATSASHEDRPILAGNLLATAGDLLRRSGALAAADRMGDESPRPGEGKPGTADGRQAGREQAARETRDEPAAATRTQAAQTGGAGKQAGGEQQVEGHGRGRGDQEHDPIDAALRALSREDLTGWLSTARVAPVREAVADAIEQAFEAALAEHGEHGGSFEKALDGLRARDRFESILRSIQRWESLGGALDERAQQRRQALVVDLAALDQALRRSHRALVALNDERRAEASLLDPDGQSVAWWYAARSQNDDDLALFSSSSMPPASRRPGRESEVLALVDRTPERHLSADDLWAHDFGLLAKEQRSWVNAHVARCRPCKQAIQAMREGEQAIAEQHESAPVPVHADEASRTRVEEHPGCRLTLKQNSKNATLRVERTGDHVLTGVSIKNGPRPRRIANGYEFSFRAHELAKREKLDVRVEINDRKTEHVVLRLDGLRAETRA